MNEKLNNKVTFRNLGTIEFQEAWDYQTRIFEDIIRIKLANRDLPVSEKKLTSNFLFFCEHPHVYTLGKSGKASNLLINETSLKEKQASFFHINRGGDITYHGPGQIVGYPVLDLENFFTDIHKYLRLMEEVVIETLRDYNIKAGRISGLTGVWVDYEQPEKARKICAFGVKTSRWVTMHGFALNVNPDLSYFKNIIPCGITDKAVTSMKEETKAEVNLKNVEEKLIGNFADIFGMEFVIEKVV